MKKIILIATICIFNLCTYAQTDLLGVWRTEDKSTLLRIEKIDGTYVGKVISSDNENVKPGDLIFKNLEQKKENYQGEIYAPKRETWYDVELSDINSTMTVTISVGFYSKTLTWTKEKI